MQNLRRMSIRLKMVIAMAGLVLALGLGGTIHARLTLAGISNDELDRRALAIAQDLEGHLPELVLTNDVLELHRRVRALATANPDLKYVVVMDDEGNTRASTFTGGLPAGLRNANSIPDGKDRSLVTLATSEGQLRDLAYRIGGGEYGVVRLGFTRERVDGRVGALTRNLLGLTAVVLVAGLMVSFLLATVLTRPLSRLAEAARAVSRGNVRQQTGLHTHPDVGQVAIAFDMMTDTLRAKEDERAQLLAKVIEAQEEERRRISRELHDEAGQALTSLILGLTRLEQSAMGEDDRKQVAELRSVSTRALDRMRDMARELRPSTLDDLGLPAALSRYLGDYSRKAGIATDFHASGLDGARLGPQVETALYRIAQEALTNVVRHSRAESVNVVLEGRDGNAVLVVEDDGCGFEIDRVLRSHNPADKLGLLGMEERATLVGGTLTIESRPGSGTAIFVQVPIQSPGGH